MNTIKKIFLISFGACIGAFVVAAANKNRPSNKRKTTASYGKSKDRVDESSEESFPASDAPAWGPSSSDKIH